MSDPPDEERPFLFTRQDLIDITNRFAEFAAGMSERYDKAILTLSAGALVLSLTFLEKIAPTPVTWSLALVFGAWAAFILSMVNVLSSHELSYDSLVEVHQNVTKDVIPEYEPKPPASRARFARRHGADDPLGKEIRRRNRHSLGWFIAGAAFMATFSALNLVARALG